MAESELTTIARPYARAVFAHALEGAAGLDEWSTMLRMLSEFAGHEELQGVLDNPGFTRAQRGDLLAELAGDAITAHGRNFISILAEQDRLEVLPEVSTLYELMKTNHQKRVEVELTSAYEVADDDCRRIQAALGESLKREVSLEAKVDASLVGGVVIRTGDSVTDYSVRGKLTKLGQAMNS